MPTRNVALFGLLCLIWGLTWVATKAGLQTVPPFLFAGSRFTTAGALIGMALLLRDGSLGLRRADALRLLVVSLFLIAMTYGLLLWGMQFIGSGTAALLELSFTPVALLGFALVLRQEPFSLARVLVIALGIAGLAMLFGPKLSAGTNPLEAWGALATVLAAVAYGWGSVLARPLIAARGAWGVAATTMVMGGLMLLAASAALERPTPKALVGAWGAAAWSGWLFLVVFGSLAGFTIYLRLLDGWGASKAGSYAFVSPAIAVLAGAIAFGERVTTQEMAGMAVMLVAAAAAVRLQGTFDATDETPNAAAAEPGQAMGPSASRHVVSGLPKPANEIDGAALTSRRSG